LKIISGNIFPRHSGKREVCRESMTNFSSIQFIERNATISRQRNFRNIVQKVEKKILETAEFMLKKASDYVLS